MRTLTPIVAMKMVIVKQHKGEYTNSITYSSDLRAYTDPHGRVASVHHPSARSTPSKASTRSSDLTLTLTASGIARRAPMKAGPVEASSDCIAQKVPKPDLGAPSAFDAIVQLIFCLLQT